jgi:hypothetical protein
MLNEWHDSSSSLCFAGLRGLEKLSVFRSPVERVVENTPLLNILQ